MVSLLPINDRVGFDFTLFLYKKCNISVFQEHLVGV